MSWSRAFSAVSLGLLVHCSVRTDSSTERAVLVDADVECVRGEEGVIGVVLCDFSKAPDAYWHFLRGELVPEREQRLWARSDVRFSEGWNGRPLSPDDHAARPPEVGSFLKPFDDPRAKHDIAGWLLLDAAQHIAMLLVGIDERMGVILTEVPASSAVRVIGVLNGMDFDEGPDALARDLRYRWRFSLRSNP